jgi:hypothetical protein
MEASLAACRAKLTPATLEAAWAAGVSAVEKMGQTSE